MISVDDPRSVTRAIPKPLDRIFFCSQVTQLMVIQHLRTHVQRRAGREFLLWSPLNGVALTDEFMRKVIAGANFDGVYDLRGLEQLKPRRHGPLTWWLEVTRRFRADASVLRNWVRSNDIDERNMELWGDDPRAANGLFIYGFFRRARRVRIPHSFEFENTSTNYDRFHLEWQGSNAPWTRKWIYWPWIKMTSGVELRGHKALPFVRSYTFDLPSHWSDESVDVTHLISLEAFDRTYAGLPLEIRDDIEGMLAPLQASRRPLVVLLLFQLDEQLRLSYQRALEAIFAQRRPEFEHCSLIVKVHPRATGEEERLFYNWLKSNISATVFFMPSVLNLEFLLPKLRPDYIWAGPCGALPVSRKLKAARCICLSDVTETMCRIHARKQQRELRDIQAQEETW